MKIAFIVSGFPTLSETFILNQITGLLDLGHEVDIFARSYPEDQKIHPDIVKYHLLERTQYFEPPQEDKLKRIFRTIGMSIKIGCKNPIIFLKSLCKLRYCRNELHLNILYPLLLFLDSPAYDIIHCHFGPNGNLGALLKWLGIKGKLVTMFHGYDIRSGIEMGGNIYHKLFKIGDCLLAISDYNYKNLISFGADPQKVVFHSVGIDLNTFSDKWESGKLHQPRPIIILTVARLVKEKGLQYGIQSVSKLLERNPMLCLKYHIVGDGPLEKELINLVEKLSLNKIVYFLGGMTQEDVIREMKKAHIFLLPSVEEALPVVLMEAQAVGLPIVATSVGSVYQDVSVGKSGFLVPERDVDALAGKLEYLILHPEVWPEMGRAGRKYVEEHYDSKKLNMKLVKIYEDILSGTSKYGSG